MKQLTMIEILGERKNRNPQDIYTGGSLSVRTLLQLVNDYKDGYLRLPAHQRELSWSFNKQLQYIETICSDGAPPGSFEIYTVVRGNDESAQFLNDGAQRLLTACALMAAPERFGLTVDTVEFILRNTEYVVRLKKHRSHKEALERFQKVNSNVPLTPYQFTRGTIIYCMGDQFGGEWEKWLDALHEGVDRSLVSITNRRHEYNPKSQNAVVLTHKSYRQTTSMFLRFISNDTAGEEYGTNTGVLKPQAEFFEMRLATHLRAIGLDDAWKKQASFHRLITDETAVIREIWEMVEKPERVSIRSATVRWLWDLSILRRNRRVPTEPWIDFITKLLRHNLGATEVFTTRTDGRAKRISLSFGRLRMFYLVAEVIGSDLAKWFDNPRRRPSRRLEDGFQYSHIMPYAKEGNGPVVAEPAMVNMARGAKPIDGALASMSSINRRKE